MCVCVRERASESESDLLPGLAELDDMCRVELEVVDHQERVVWRDRLRCLEVLRAYSS